MIYIYIFTYTIHIHTYLLFSRGRPIDIIIPENNRKSLHICVKTVDYDSQVMVQYISGCQELLLQLYKWSETVDSLSTFPIR